MGGRDRKAKAIWVSSLDHVYRLVPPRIDEAVNPIGCGDSLGRGIAWATRRGDAIVDALHSVSGRRRTISGSCCHAGWTWKEQSRWRSKSK